jgi:hypothetical protein
MCNRFRSIKECTLPPQFGAPRIALRDGGRLDQTVFD